MIYPSLQELLFDALCLVIPAAIVLGHRRSNGPLVVCGGAALCAFAAFWLLMGGINSFRYGTPGGFPVGILTFFGGILLLLAAWALALSAAAQARRWEWVGLLTAAGYLSVVAVIYSISPPDPCIFGPPPYYQGRFAPVCTPHPFAYLLVIAGYLAGPAATLAYGLRPDGLRRSSRALPEGVSVSSLRAASDPARENID